MTAVDFEQFPRCPKCNEELELDSDGMLACPMNYDHYHVSLLDGELGMED